MITILQKRQNFAEFVALTLVLVGVFVLQYRSQQYFSPVYDEVANIPAGYNFLLTGRYPDATHPPLIRYVLSIPMFWLGADVMLQDSAAHDKWKEYGTRFLLRNTSDWQCLLSASRTVNIFISLILAASVFVFTRRRWGAISGFCALLFLAFEPSFLAHGQLATLDIGFALTYFWAAWALENYIKKPSKRRYWYLHLAVGVAFLSKFMALPIFFAGLLCLVVFKKQQGALLRKFWLSPLIFSAMIFVAYLCQVKQPSSDLQITKTLEKEIVSAQMDTYAAKLGYTKEALLDIPVPFFDFWKGFGMQMFHAMLQDVWESKENFQYLDGQYSRRGWRRYFVMTFLYKSTLATLFLTAILFGLYVLKKINLKNSTRSVAAWCLVAPPLFLFAACSLSTINIGHRYILALYPFLAVGFGYLTAVASERMKLFVLFLLIAHIWSSLAAWPHHLSYFNELSRSGYRLADSNIDWGQDLLFLKKDWLEQQNREGVTCWGDCFGVIRPEHLGVLLKPVPASQAEMGTGKHIVYLSVHRYLNRNIVKPEGIYPWLQNQQPVRKVGSAILVFELEN